MEGISMQPAGGDLTLAELAKLEASLEREINEAYDFGDFVSIDDLKWKLAEVRAARQSRERETGGRSMEGPNEREKGPASDIPGKIEWTNLAIKSAFLEERVNKATGEVFYDVCCPPRTKLAGAIDVGGYHFTVGERRVHDSKFDRNGVVVGVMKDRPLKLTKSLKQDDGSYKEIAREVDPENLRLALIAQHKAYKAEKAAERAAKRASPERRGETSPAKDQRTAAKSVAARAKNPRSAPAQQRSR